MPPKSFFKARTKAELEDNKFETMEKPIKPTARKKKVKVEEPIKNEPTFKPNVIYVLNEDTGELEEHGSYYSLLCQLAFEMNSHRDLENNFKAYVRKPALKHSQKDYEEAFKDEFINDWDFNFISSMASKKQISEKQLQILNKIEHQVSLSKV